MIETALAIIVLCFLGCVALAWIASEIYIAAERRIRREAFEDRRRFEEEQEKRDRGF